QLHVGSENRALKRKVPAKSPHRKTFHAFPQRSECSLFNLAIYVVTPAANSVYLKFAGTCNLDQSLAVPEG
ncbi:hypothetical protein L208DRAFT_1458189, partial [Tricholoma matsutake]